MTKGLIKSSQTKLNYYKKTLLSNYPETDHERYKEYRNKYNILKRQTHIQFYNDKCIEHKNNTCKLWKIVNSIMCKLNDKTSCIDHIKINNIASYNPYDICNVFAEHFALTGKNLAQKIPSPKKNIHDYINTIPRQVQSLYLSQTTKQEVKELINKLPNKTS